MAASRIAGRIELATAVLGRFDEIAKLLAQGLSFNLTGHETFGLQPLFDFLDRHALPGFRQLECAL